MLGPVLLRLLCITVTTAAAPHAVTKVSAMTSTVPGSGMDSEGAFSFLGLHTGGSFAVEICQVMMMMGMMMMMMMLTMMMIMLMMMMMDHLWQQIMMMMMAMSHTK